MTVIATCGHRIIGIGEVFALKDTTHDGLPAISYEVLCWDCMNYFFKLDYILETEAEEESYLLGQMRLRKR